MSRCMYVQNLRVISVFLHLFENNNKNVHPVKIITDIYTAAHPCKYQWPDLLSSLVTGQCLYGRWGVISCF